MASKPFSQASANLAAMVDALSDLVQQDRPDYDVTMKIVGLIGREHGVIRTCLDNTATHDDLLHRLPQLTSTRKKQQEVMMSMCGKMEDSQIEQFCLYILDLDNIIRDVVNALDSRTKEDTAKDNGSILSDSSHSDIFTPKSEFDEPLAPAENLINSTCAKVELLVDRVEKMVITYQNPPQKDRNDSLASGNGDRMLASFNEPKLPEAVQDSDLVEILQRLLSLDETLQADNIQCSEVQGLIALCIRWLGTKGQ
ncbi:MAG: hypothetical protein LQ346_003094 [Caloplaca aetnensis]|nr:MAG: hypothetical protein LQ346_003094 [Caloplaca aetnensis]